MFGLDFVDNASADPHGPNLGVYTATALTAP